MPATALRAVEERIAALLAKHVSGARPRGLVKCAADEGVTSCSGGYESGLVARTQHDLDEFLDGDAWRAFSDLLSDSRAASKAEPLGPWYRSDIEIAPGPAFTFRYWWEGTPFSSPRELEPDAGGGVPNFAFRQRFDRAFVDALTDLDVNNCLLFYVPARVARGAPVTEPLFEIYGVLEWEGDVNNGAMNQYFAREHEPMTRLPRTELYARTYRGLRRIGHDAGAQVYADSLAVYANFYPRVAAARDALGIPPVAEEGSPNLMERYDELQRSIEAARIAYVRAHVEDIAIPP